MAITDDDSAQRNALQSVWQDIILLLCHFHHLQAVWAWLWKREHDILKNDRPALFNLLKKVVYAESNQTFEDAVTTMKENETYRMYGNYKTHVEIIFYKDMKNGL